MKTSVLFSVGPYLALALFAAAAALRTLLTRQRLAAAERELFEGRRGWRGGALWRAGVGLLVLGHLAGFFFPKWILAWNASPTRLYLLELAALAAGVAALAGWLGLVWRHLGRGTRSLAAELADTAFLSLIGVGLVSGILAALLHRWGSSWGAMILTPYAASVLRGEPQPELATQLPFLVQLHVVAALAALAFAPLTRLGLLLSVALHRVLRAAGAPFVAGDLAVETWLQKHNPRPWIWPDED